MTDITDQIEKEREEWRQQKRDAKVAKSAGWDRKYPPGTWFDWDRYKPEESSK